MMQSPALKGPGMSITTVNLIFTLLHDSYVGQHAPNVEDAWDDLRVDDNRTGFDEAVVALQKQIGTDYQNVAVVPVQIDTDRLDTAPDGAFDREGDNRGNGEPDYFVRLIICGYVNGADGGPYAMVESAWDYYTLEDNYDGFIKEMDELEARIGKEDLVWIKVIDIVVDPKAVDNAMRPPVAKARVLAA